MPAVRVLPARRVIISSTYRARKQAYKRSVKQRYRPAQNRVRAGGLLRKIWCLFWCLFGVYLVLIWCLCSRKPFLLTCNKVDEQSYIRRCVSVLNAILLHLTITHTHWQSRGHGFDPHRLHHIKNRLFMRIGGFSLTFCNALEMLACGGLVSCPLFVLYWTAILSQAKA